jgi:hypothetical protein
MMPLSQGFLTALVLAMPIAAISWAVTHEEVLREPRDFCLNRSQSASTFAERKFFYLFTCEYCFSHWVTLLFLAMTDFKLLYDDWRGYVVGGFTLVWLANHYMSLFGRLRLGIKSERIDVSLKEELRDKVSNG